MGDERMAPDDTRRNRPKLRSRITVEGLDRTPHRAFLRAIGLDDEALARPMVGVVTTEGEMTPCTMGLRDQAQGQAGHRRGRRHAARVHHHRGLRRHLDEPSRHEVSA